MNFSVGGGCASKRGLVGSSGMLCMVGVADPTLLVDSSAIYRIFRTPSAQCVPIAALNMTMSMVLNNKANTLSNNSRANYKLRDVSIKKREEMEIRKNQPKKRGPKPRPKSAPMSKYRRKTANLRERLRMGEINVAFEKLRDKLPNPMAQAGKAKCEKLTKINILHVAINYIRAMENLLETGDSGIHSFSEMTKNPLRDESDRKIEMQRVLATLMARADNNHKYHQARSKNKKRRSQYNPDEETSSSSSDEDEVMEEDDEDDDDGDSEQWDVKPHLDSPKYTLDSPKYTSVSSDHSTSQNAGGGTPDTSWSTSTSNDSNASSSLTISPTNLVVTSNSLNSSCVESTTNNSISTTNSLLDPMLNHLQGSFNSTLKNLTTVTEPKLSCNNNNEDLMKDFTEFVDLVDSLHGMPEIDFEDNFEMFPC